MTSATTKPRRDRLREGVAILADLSLSDMEAINQYDRQTLGLSGPTRAFGLHTGLMRRAAKREQLKATTPSPDAGR